MYIHCHTMKTDNIIFRIEPELRDAIKALADERGSSISQIIRQAVLEHLKKSGITIKKSNVERG